MVGSSLPPVVCRRADVLFTLWSGRLYLQLFVGGFMSYLCYLCLFGSSLPPVVCRRVHILFTLWSVCRRAHVLFVRLYLQLCVGELMSYLRYLCLFGSSLPPVVCRRVHVLFTLWSVCRRAHVLFVRLYLQLFVGGFMSYLRYGRFVGGLMSCLFVFTSSCL